MAGVEAAGMNPGDSPKVQELRSKLANDAVDVGAPENEVYDHLFSFFRRYYSEGDFLANQCPHHIARACSTALIRVGVPYQCASVCCKVLHLIRRSEAMAAQRGRKPSGKPRATRASASLPPELYVTLQEIAKQKKVSVAWVIRDAAEKYIAEQWPLFAQT